MECDRIGDRETPKEITMKMKILLLSALSLLMFVSCIDLLDLGLKATDLMHNVDFGLAFYYPFNGDTQDASGNGNHGTPHGTYSFFEADRFGNNNKTFGVNAGSYLDTNWGKDFNPSLAFSVNFWLLYPNFILEGGSKYLFGIASSTFPPSGVRFFLSKEEEGGTFDMTFAMYSYGFDTDKDSITFVDLWSELIDAKWHMITIVHESGTGSDKLHLYVDGVKRTPTSTSAGEFGSAQMDGSIYLLAARDMADDSPLDETIYTTIDDFRFFTRTLDEMEITALYHKGGFGL
jgi:hypothetical protein